MNRREMLSLGTVAALAACARVSSAARNPASLEMHPGALPPSATLPDPLVFRSGKPVENCAEWWLRRKEILATAAGQMYGTAPSRPKLRFQLLEEGTAFKRLARRRQLRLQFASDAKTGANVLLYTPAHVRRAPVIVGLNFWGNHTLSMDPQVLLATSWVESGRNIYADLTCVQNHHATAACRGIDAHRWPVQQILERGYGLCTAYRGDIDADLPDESIPGLRVAYPQLQARGDNFATIGAWAWALRRMLDYLETDPSVDARRAVVFGWSRLGKASLWAGAQDQRFAAVLSQESGAGGAKLFRDCAGEDIHRLTTVFPHWFCRNFARYSGMDCRLPFDQHLILAAIAPRPLFVASALEDHLSDPPGEFASTRLASKVYRFLGSEGLPSDTMPAPGSPLIGHVSYQVRPGGHDVQEYDWEQYLQFLDKYL